MISSPGNGPKNSSRRPEGFRLRENHRPSAPLMQRGPSVGLQEGGTACHMRQPSGACPQVRSTP